MVFPKLTRQRIFAADGKPVEIAWPQDGPEPKKGRKYSFQSATDQAGDTKVLVLAASEQANGWRVTVRLDADPVRLLGKAGGYTTSPAGAMAVRAQTEHGIEVEPEAVDSAYQRRLSEEAQIGNAMARGHQRQIQRKLGHEARLAEARVKNPGSVRVLERKIRAAESHLRPAA